MKARYNGTAPWRRGLLAFPPLAAIVCALVLVLPAMAANIINENMPVSGQVFNPCNGETVTFSGVDHFIVLLTLDNHGGFHAMVHDNISVTATGDLGNTYVGNQENNDSFNGKVGVEETSTFTFSEISKGSAPNFVVQALFHITINPDGTVTAFVDNFSATCRG